MIAIPQATCRSWTKCEGRSITRSYIYGLELIEQDRIFYPTQASSFYIYDGHGSVRALTDLTGAVTDSYDYDAFGNVVHSTGSPPNNYLYSGQQFDPDLHLYYNRARYLNVSTGHFWTMDTIEGDPTSPLSLHKYLYGNADPVGMKDPSGQFVEVNLGATALALGIAASIGAFELGALALYLRHEKAVVAGTAALEDAKILGAYALSNLMNQTGPGLAAQYFSADAPVIAFVTARYEEIFQAMYRQIAFETGDKPFLPPEQSLMYIPLK